MSNIDYLSLNGQNLRVFLTVLEEGSVSKAAERLGITQSAVSHSLERLRVIFNDPLFARSGRGIEATERAIALRDPIQSILDKMKKLMDQRAFDPRDSILECRVAANDFQRNLIFPRLLKHFGQEGIHAHFRFVPSGVPDAEILRQDKCDIIITPFPPDASDIYQLKLFDDHLVCFYDSNVRSAPKTWEEFCDCDFIEASFSDQKSSLFALSKHDRSHMKKPIVSVPNFGAIADFVLESQMITVAMNLMKISELKSLATAPLPFTTPPVSMYMVWHIRNHSDPAHEWFRSQIQLITQDILKLK